MHEVCEWMDTPEVPVLSMQGDMHMGSQPTSLVYNDQQSPLVFTVLWTYLNVYSYKMYLFTERLYVLGSIEILWKCEIEKIAYFSWFVCDCMIRITWNVLCCWYGFHVYVNTALIRNKCLELRSHQPKENRPRHYTVMMAILSPPPKIFENTSPFRGATDILVLDFWWRCPGLKSGWIPCVR